MESRKKQIITLSLALFLLLALALRLYRIDAQSLWNDEGTSVALAQRDLATIARDAAYDIHPPLYYWLLSGWIRLTGTSEAAVRSLSALLGVALVALTYALGRLLGGRWTGLAAAFLAAINPFQVYYSQEARMYMLLALWGAVAFYAALAWAAPEPGEGLHRWGAVYVLAAAAGLYTHYAFPMVLAAINLVVLLDIALRGTDGLWKRRLWHWLALQATAVLLFAPWLPTAYRQLTTWPGPAEPGDLMSALSRTGSMLIAGVPDSGDGGHVLIFFLLLLSVLPLLGWKLPPTEKRLSDLVACLVPVTWVFLPIVAMLGLGLTKDAYLKFLLVASPASCLLIGRVLAATPWRRPPLPDQHPRLSRLAAISFNLGRFVILAAFVSWSALVLSALYTDPSLARDDYRGMAAYVEAVGRPGDAVLLNAPGQQEVFGYYYRGSLPVYPLPQSRPLDPAATEAALQELARPGGRVFALLWATDESDPGRFVEGWLDSHAYKALDSWYGNVRLAVYAVAQRTPNRPDQVLDVRLQGAEAQDEITLLGYSLLNERLAAGDIAQITLFWQAERAPGQRYKAFLHVLDGGNHIVGQRDAEPGGGARLTTLWAPGETVADNHGVSIHPATPPGEYRVEVGLYSLDTGQRLLTPQGESQVWLEPLAVDRPPAPPPLAALGMQHAKGADFGELRLLGYDAYRLGYDESVPLRPGDVLHTNLYWQAAAQPGGDWQVVLGLVDSRGQEGVSITAEPVGGYATRSWERGDVWRGQFNLVVPADLPPGRYRLRTQPIAPDGSLPEPFLSEPLVVEQ